MTRRKFLYSATLASVGAVSAAQHHFGAKIGAEAYRSPRPFDLDEVSVSALSDGMKSGQFTARILAEKYLNRIQEIDHRGPAINAVIEINPGALAIAEALDRERKAKGPRGPLHGIPVLIKDNIGTHDRMMTAAGSLALLGSVPPRDAFVAQRLREAGAVISGQNQSQRVGQHSLQPFFERLERARRANAQSLRAGPQSLRVEFRLWRGRGREPLRRGGGNGNGRLHCLPVIRQRRCRHQADAGPGEPHRNYSHRSFSGHCRPDGAHCRGCRRLARRAGRNRSG